MSKITIEGINIYYEVHGQGQPLLLIHGLGSSCRDWEFQVGRFSPHYKVVTFDVRGHGKTDKPPGPYSLPQFARDTAALIGALQLAPAHVVGISMGGMIGFQLAVDSPQLIRSLVVVNATPEFRPQRWVERIAIQQRLLIIRLLGMRKMAGVLSKRLFPKPEQEELRRVLIERWSENDKRAYLDSMKALIGWSVADRIHQIEIPTLIVTGDNDYAPVSVKERYLARMPNAELVVIPDSTHATPVDQPERFNQEVIQFLTRYS
ncbi:MAG: alpha/beta hydrolase [Chloroflexota bacterium]